MFIEQYIRWNSFCPKARNISLIKTVVHTTLTVCSETRLGLELDRIKQLLIENGHPEDVLLSCIKQNLANFAAGNPFGNDMRPVYLKFPWNGNVSSKVEKQVYNASISWFYAMKPCIVILGSYYHLLKKIKLLPLKKAV